MWHQGSPSSPAAALAALELPASLSWETHTSFLPVRPVLLGFGCTEWINTYRENRIPRVCVLDGLLWDEQRCIYSVTPGSQDITVSWRKGELGWGWEAAQGAWRCYLPHLPSHGFWQGRVLSPGIHLGAFLSSLSFLSSLLLSLSTLYIGMLPHQDQLWYRNLSCSPFWFLLPMNKCKLNVIYLPSQWYHDHISLPFPN